MKKQLDRISKNAEMLMSKKEISAEAKQQLETAVKVSYFQANCTYCTYIRAPCCDGCLFDKTMAVVHHISTELLCNLLIYDSLQHAIAH